MGRRKGKLKYLLLLIPAVVVLGGLTVFPFIYNVWASLHHYTLTNPFDVPFAGLENFKTIFVSDSRFWSALGRTACFTGGALAIEFLLGMAIALALNRDFRGRSVLRVLLMFPMMATPIAVAFMWRIMYNPSLGVINYFLDTLGLPSVDWVSGISTAMISIIIVDVWQWTPFLALILLAGLMSLPREPLEAAKVDGASPGQSFVYVTVPLLWPVMLVALILRLIDLLKTFDIIYTLTGGGPGYATETVNIYAFYSTFLTFEIGYGASLTIIMLAITIAICSVLVRRFTAKIMT